MANYVTPSIVFERKVKRLLKKFRTLSESLLELENELIGNPFIGSRLAESIYKIRVPDKSKGRGKSGGFRVITYVVKSVDVYYEIILLTIYDKSETETIKISDIKQLIKEDIENNRL